MTKKHNIKISSEYNNRITTNVFVRQYIRDFMSWLVGKGHKVSYSLDTYTTVDGNKISNDKAANDIYTKLLYAYDDYRYKPRV